MEVTNPMNHKPFVRIVCLVIAALMIASVLSTVIFQLAYSF